MGVDTIFVAVLECMTVRTILVNVLDCVGVDTIFVDVLECMTSHNPGECFRLCGC